MAQCTYIKYTIILRRSGLTSFNSLIGASYKMVALLISYMHFALQSHHQSVVTSPATLLATASF